MALEACDMDLNSIIASAEIIMRVANLALKAGQDMAPFVRAAYKVIVEKQPLSVDERTKMLDDEKRLRDILQEPETD